MTKKDIEAAIDTLGKNFPERMSGNEQNRLLTEQMAELVETQRPIVVELLRDWLAVRIPESQRQPDSGKREGSMWLALEVVQRYELDELRPDIEALLADVRSGETYLPYYADTISKYLH